MQLGVRLAATLLALTAITPITQGAPVFREFTLIDRTDCGPVPGPALILDGGRITPGGGSTAPLQFPAGAGASVVEPFEQQPYLRLCRRDRRSSPRRVPHHLR